MNFALPAFVLVVLCLPGIAWRRAYHRGLRGLPIRPRALVEEASLSVIAAAMLHCGWLVILHWTRRLCHPTCLLGNYIGLDVDFSSIFQMIAGSYASGSAALDRTSKSIAENTGPILAYFVSLIGVATFVGYLTHWLVCRFKWLRAILGTKILDDWHRILVQPNRLARVSAVVPMGQRDYLYRGWIAASDSLVFGDNGELDRLILFNADRRPLDRDNNQQSQNYNSPRFYEIQGDFFVLRYSDTKTLNVLAFDLFSNSMPWWRRALVEIGLRFGKVEAKESAESESCVGG